MRFTEATEICSKLLQVTLDFFLVSQSDKQERPPFEIVQSVAQCLTLCDPMDCSVPGSSVHGILQVRILEQVAISYSRGSSWLKDGARISCISCTSWAGSWVSYYSAPWKAAKDKWVTLELIAVKQFSTMPISSSLNCILYLPSKNVFCFQVFFRNIHFNGLLYICIKYLSCSQVMKVWFVFTVLFLL